MADAEASTFKTDYAATDRSTCNRCRQSIAKAELRVGPMVQSPKGDFKYPQWHHFTCFEDGWLKKHPGALKDVATVSGIDALRFEDQKKIKSLIVGGDSTLETKPMTEEEKLLEQDLKLVWAKKEKLEELDNAELQEILEENAQPNKGKIFGGRPKMIERISDGMVFGALPKCALCKDGDFYSSHGVYKCTGAMDEYAKCENKVSESDMKRGGWKIPSDISEAYGFLKNWKFKPRVKRGTALEGSSALVNPVVVANRTLEKDDDDDDTTKAPPKASKSAAAIGTKRKREANDTAGGDTTATTTSSTATAAPVLPPFGGCAVVFAGKLSRNQAELKKLITDNGGAVAATVKGANICVCTPEEAAGNGTQKGKDAVKGKVMCVSESWVDDSIKEGKRLVGATALAKYVLANPIHGSGNEDDEERAKRKLLGDKLELARTAAAEREKLEEKFTDKAAGGRKDVVVAGATKSAATGREVKKLVVKGSAAVEPDSGLSEKGKIYEPKPGEVYSSIMNLADVSTGQNSFYIIQIIEHDTGKKWTCFRKWGKVGNEDIGGKKLTEYPSPSAAVREFEKIFSEKTGNPWSNRSAKGGFKKVYGKFMPIDIDYSDGNDGAGGPPGASGGGSSGSAPQGFSNAGYKGPLDRATQELMTIIFDIKAMNDTLKEMEIDIEKMPLGKLSKNTIGEGYKALKDLQGVMESHKDVFAAIAQQQTSGTATSSDGNTGGGAAPPPMDHALRAQVVSLSNKFYSFIPHIAPLGEKLPLLDTLNKLKQKVELLTALQELEVASKLLSSEKSISSKQDHPIDVHYEKLKTDMETVPHNSDEFKMIRDYVINTHGKTHTTYSLDLIDLWKVDRQGESERYKPFADDKNRQLLWHGSRTTNWGGILSQGLRIAPPEAPSTGYMFGKGVYFADMCSKSANYCFTSSEKNTGIMMLAEVALGDMKELKKAFYVDKLEKPYKSAKGVGQYHPDPKEQKVTDTGALIPMGKGVHSGVHDTTLLYNEFIVYDVSQIRIKYLLRLDFKYKQKCGTFF